MEQKKGDTRITNYDELQAPQSMKRKVESS